MTRHSKIIGPKSEGLFPVVPLESGGGHRGTKFFMLTEAVLLLLRDSA